jgi:hypothetical protein
MRRQTTGGRPSEEWRWKDTHAEEAGKRKKRLPYLVVNPWRHSEKGAEKGLDGSVFGYYEEAL